jgi:hypothetical protein
MEWTALPQQVAIQHETLAKNFDGGRHEDIYLLSDAPSRNNLQPRIVTRHCRPSCSVGMGAYSRDVTAPVHSLRSSEASIPTMVIGMLD